MIDKLLKGLLIVGLLFPTIAMSQPMGYGIVSIVEEDGTPTTYPYLLKVTNDTLIDNGDGTVSLNTGGGGGAVEGTAVLSTGEVGGTKFLRENGDGTSSWQTTSGGGSPGGSDTQIQFNDGGAFGGALTLIWDKINNDLKLKGNGYRMFFGSADQYSIQFNGGNAIHTVPAGNDFLFENGDIIQARNSGAIQFVMRDTNDGDEIVLMMNRAANYFAVKDVNGQQTFQVHPKAKYIFGTSEANGLNQIFIQNDQAMARFVELKPGQSDHFTAIGAGNFDWALFENSSSGTIPEFRISGYKAGDALRTLTMKVSSIVDDTFEFSGVGNYTFDGNTYWVGAGSGLPYGSMYNHDTSTIVTIGAMNTATRVPDGFTQGQVNLTTFQNAREIVIDKAGRYKIDWSISFTTVNANQEIEGFPMINNVMNIQASAHRRIATGTDTGDMSGVCVLDLSASDVVALGVLNETSASNIIIEHSNMTIIHIGG